MKRFFLISLSFVSLTVMTTGCGGVGGIIAGAEAKLSATPNPVIAGQPITVKWGGNKLTRGKSNDFGAPSTSMSGTITDKSAVSLTYNYSAYGKNGENAEIQLDASASVVVVKSSKSVLVFGDPAAAGTNQVADFMRGITTGSVRVDNRAITTTPSEELIIIHPSLTPNIGDGGWDTIAPVLLTGKSIIVIGESTLKALAINDNVASIGGYFGGATGFSNGILPTERVRASDGLVPLSVKYRGQRVTLDAGGGRGLTGVGGSADILISSSAGTQAMVYNVPSGGRVGFLTRDGVGSTAQDAYYAWALQSMARWCMDM